MCEEQAKIGGCEIRMAGVRQVRDSENDLVWRLGARRPMDRYS